MIAILTYTNITLSSSEAVPPWWCSPLPSVGHLLGPCPSRKRGTPRKEALTPWGRTKATKVVSPNKKIGYSARKYGVLVGGIATPLKKYESQLGWFFPMYGKVKNVPNHQSGVGRFLPWLVSIFGVWDKILFEDIWGIMCYSHIPKDCMADMNISKRRCSLWLYNVIQSNPLNDCQCHIA